MNKKILYIDGWFLKPPLRGVGKYINNILISLPKNQKNIEYILLIPNNKFDLSHFPSYLKIKYIECKFVIFWYEYYLPTLLKKTKNATIFYPSGILGLFSSYKNVKLISTIHDVASFLPLKYNPITFDLKKILGRIYRRFSFYKIVKNSKIIFTVSKTAKKGIKDIIMKEKLELPEILVAYNASEINKLSNTSKRKNFLCITGESKHKNYKCILNAFDFIQNNYLKGWTIYFVGLNQDSEINHKCGMKIIKTKYQNLHKIRELYSQSYCLIFPSFYESFGIPLVDALNSNCHIIASSKGSSTEICDRSALYFNPESPKELSRKILEMVNFFPETPKIDYENIILRQTWSITSEYIFKKINQMIF